MEGALDLESAHLFNKLRLLFQEKLVKLCPGQKRNEAYSSWIVTAVLSNVDGKLGSQLFSNLFRVVLQATIRHKSSDEASDVRSCLDVWWEQSDKLD